MRRRKGEGILLLVGVAHVGVDGLFKVGGCVGVDCGVYGGDLG